MSAANEELFTTLGGLYSIERELGGGGMSRVFLATEIGLGRNVVIKIVAPDIATQCWRPETMVCPQANRSSGMITPEVLSFHRGK